MKIICISDTHNLHKDLKIPDGDILIHAGDMTCVGGIDEIKEFNQWLGPLPHRYKIVIAGNHDLYLESAPSIANTLITKSIYLNDSGIEVEGLRLSRKAYELQMEVVYEPIIVEHNYLLLSVD